MTPPLDTPNTGSVLRPGRHLGRYQIIRRLAVGGMAELYLARHVGDAGYQKVVALKRVRPHLAEDQQFVARFLNEARLAANLDHSNIAHVIDFGTDRGEHFMAMEYVHGRSVLELLRCFESSPLPLACALMIVRDLAAALHHAHERNGPDGRPLGLVHRDVSPSNVLVSFDGDVKLVDFGIAKATAESDATRTGTILGKLAYMAPEQLRGQRIDRRSDVFALCTVAYELMTGTRCFYAEGEFALINRVVASRFDRPTTIVDGFPIALEQILVKGLSAAADARFADARALQLALEAFATDAGYGLSKVELSEHMRRTFGDEAYPRTDVVLPPADLEHAQTITTTTASTPSRSRRRSLVPWVGAALATGLVVGLVTREWVGDDDADTAAVVAAPPRSDTATTEKAVAADVTDAHVGAAARLEATPAAVVPASIGVAPAKQRRARTPARTQKSKRSASTPSRTTDDSTLRDFMPPSRRDDG